jgi:hypothetical protein
MLKLVALSLAVAACGPETTSFRTTDRSDPAAPGEATSAAYQLPIGATVHVWSNGGYMSLSDEPMTHIGFDIRNTSTRPIVFDGDALQLVVRGSCGAALPATRFVTITPLGPSQVTVAPGMEQQLDTYYELGVRPRVVDTMQIRWRLRAGDATSEQVTSFVRDDDNPVIDYRVEPARAPS